MKRHNFTIFALATILALITTVSGSADVVRSFDESVSVDGKEQVRIDLPVGKLIIQGTSGSTAHFKIEVDCKRRSSRCERDAAALELELDDRSDRIRLQIKEWPTWSTGGLSIVIVASLPSHLAVSADVGVGDVQIDDLASDLSLDVGVGDVRINGASSAVRSVQVDSGIGKASIRIAGETFSERSFFLGNETRWTEGSGEARIEVDMGVGAIEVDLL